MINDLKILSHGKVADLSNGFSLTDGKCFSICVVPKTATMDLGLTVNCRLICDGESSPLPVFFNDWAPAKIQYIAPNAISLADYDVYWGAHETI